MGQVDNPVRGAAWEKIRRPGCNCDYCIGNYNHINEYNSAGIAVRKLNDGEIQFCSGAKKLGVPGCLKVQKAQSAFNPGPGLLAVTVKSFSPKQTGFNCHNCNQRNDYAEANQPNGTYVCFNCR